MNYSDQTEKDNRIFVVLLALEKKTDYEKDTDFCETEAEEKVPPGKNSDEKTIDPASGSVIPF